VRQQFAVDELEQLAVALLEKLIAFPAVEFALGSFWVGGSVFEGRGPILPAERTKQRGREGFANRFSRFAVSFFLRIKDPEEENPRQFGNILKGAGAIRAPHDVADGFDERGK